MNHSQMSYRCPTAKFIRPIYLRGWELAMFGHATIVPRKQAAVPGALWSITTDDLEALDAYEGEPFYYRRRKWSQDGEQFFFYEMNPPLRGNPTDGYIQGIRTGYIDCGLDPNELDLRLTQKS